MSDNQVLIRVSPGGQGSVAYELRVGETFFKRARLAFGQVPEGMAACMAADAALGYLLWRPAFLGIDGRNLELDLVVCFTQARPYLLEAVRPRDPRFRQVMDQLGERLGRIPQRRVTVDGQACGVRSCERTVAYDASHVPENTFPGLSVDKTDEEAHVRLVVKNDPTAEFLMEAAFRPYGLSRGENGDWLLPSEESKRFMDWLLAVKGTRRKRASPGHIQNRAGSGGGGWGRGEAG